jgi:hypothetical protein
MRKTKPAKPPSVLREPEPTREQAFLLDLLTQKAEQVAKLTMEHLPVCPERSLALRKLRVYVMWARAAMVAGG